MDKILPPGLKKIERSLTTVGATKDYAIFEGVFRGHRFLLRYYFSTGKLHLSEKDLRRELESMGLDFNEWLELTKKYKDIKINKNW